MVFRAAAQNPKGFFLFACIAAALLKFQQSIPHHKKREFERWALMDEPPFVQPHARLPLAALFLSPFLIALLIENRKSIWFALTFRPIPKTRKHHWGCVIWLHGIGDSGSGFKWLEDLIALKHLKWVLPNARKRKVDLLGGITKRAWFNMANETIKLTEPDDKEALDKSVAEILALIESQIADGFPPEKIVLGGFSMGAALAPWVVASCPHALGGCAIWSGYATSAGELGSALAKCPSVGARMPWAYAHGEDDKKVLPECGKKLVDLLKAAGANLAHTTYDEIGHGCCDEQVDELRAFLTRTLPNGEEEEGREGQPRAKKKAKAGKKKDD
jgi:predicted esterase